MEQLSLLRSVAQRLVVTPIEELPRQAGFLATSLSSCSLLGEEERNGIDFSGPLHRIRTRLSSLLQGRSYAERLTAAVVIKSYIETVRPVESNLWESWVRGIIAWLNKPDPWEGKIVYLTTATRIFIKCHGVTALQREVVSPLLPAFLNASLAAVKPTHIQTESKSTTVTSRLLGEALRSWSEIVQLFSTTLRPFVSRLRQVCLLLLGEHSGQGPMCDAAVRLLSLLHLCAPKATGATEWEQNVANVVLAIHQSLDVLFRGIVEDWTSSSTALSQRTVDASLSGTLKLSEVDAAGLSPWSGSFDGTRRVLVLLKWLTGSFSAACPPVGMPFGAIIDLTSRLTYVTIPTSTNHIKTKSEITKDERDELWTSLPHLHAQCFELLEAMSSTFGEALRPMDATICSQILDVFEAEYWNKVVCEKSYATMAQLIKFNKRIIQPAHASTFTLMLKTACRDVGKGQAASSLSSATSITGQGHGTPVSKQSPDTPPTIIGELTRSTLVEAACELLLAAYELPSGCVPHAVRTEMDRTAIWGNHESLLLASTMYPPNRIGATSTLPSLLPFLVRSRGGHLKHATEALLRPRIPSLQTTSRVELREADYNGNDVSMEEAELETTTTNGLGHITSRDDQYTHYGTDPAPFNESTVAGSSKILDSEIGSTASLATKRKFSQTEVLEPEPLAAPEEAVKRLRQPADGVQMKAQQTNSPTNGHITKDVEVEPAKVPLYTASDAVTIHSAPLSTEDETRVIPNSDDESDIPEIDVAADTDDEDEME
ncbi:Pre-rRNA-processing protein rix1 [Cyphellophora attinorum]|uniref:Pre-rRNA-processing protein RIX1 n=1 Tax=Cyphellophora attinorum TaxID=1664694 RepID=A0A0N0NNB7_9EURO|nr:Pre-rRNA-processing protein rix1 [Phialophora attinorum]KPI41431.1 Pre-rRNA-processing protein rix1 [Phialophora attinorum]